MSMVSFSENPVVSSSSHADVLGEYIDADDLDHSHHRNREQSHGMDRRSSFGMESMTDAFHCTTLSSGGRGNGGSGNGNGNGGGNGRQRTSTGGGSGGSARRSLRSGSKKIHRKGTPYAAADRPRVHRPARLSEADMVETEIDRMMEVEPGLGQDEYGESRVRYGGGRRSGSGSGCRRSSSGGASVRSSGGRSDGCSGEGEEYGSYLTHVMSCVDTDMEESQFDLLATTPPASALAVRRSRRLSHSSSAVKENK